MKKKMKNSEFISRLLQAFKLKEEKQLAKLLGVTASVITAWKKGSNKPNYELIFSKSESRRINLHWLLTGEGEMYLRDTGVMTAKEQQLFKLGRLVYEATQMIEEIDKNEQAPIISLWTCNKKTDTLRSHTD